VQANDRGEAFCPACDRMLEKQDFSAEIPPFWKRMPAAFLYPLKPASLIFLTIMSLASLLQLVPLGGIIAAILLPFILMKYSFQVLQFTAVGHMNPPVGSTSMEARDFELPIKSILQLIVIGIVIGLSAMLGMLGIVISLVVMALIFPAMIMVLGVTRSFFKAINPVELADMVRMIGPSYLGLVGMLFLLYGSSGALLEFVGPAIIPHNILAILAIVTFISSYYTIVMFHIMGYVIYQFHEELGVQPEVEYEPAGVGKKSEPTGLSAVAKAQLLVQEGHPEVAKPFIAQQLSSEMSAEQIQLHEIYIKLLKQDESTHDELKRIAKDYILGLMEHGHGKKALQMFHLCHEVDPKFRLDHAEHTHTLMQAAQKASDFELMLALANNFAKHHPDYPNLFEVYLAVARVLHEHFKRDKQAATILKSLITKFPQHASIQQAKMALARIVRAQQPAEAGKA
jgi:hypothetical protein